MDGAVTVGRSAPRLAGPARVARGATAAGFATLVALASHVLAGAPGPGALGVVVPWVFATQAGVLVAGLRHSWVRLSASVLVSQALFHWLFVLGTPHPAGALAPAPGAGHHHAHVNAHVAMPDGLGHAVHVHSHAGHGGVWMLVAHVAAAVVTTIALHRAEAALGLLRRFAEQLRAAVRCRLEPPAPAPAARLAPVPLLPRRVHRPSIALMTTGLGRRGPPRPLSV